MSGVEVRRKCSDEQTALDMYSVVSILRVPGCSARARRCWAGSRRWPSRSGARRPAGPRACPILSTVEMWSGCANMVQGRRG